MLASAVSVQPAVPWRDLTTTPALVLAYMIPCPASERTPEPSLPR
jgi:hypothetical protein